MRILECAECGCTESFDVFVANGWKCPRCESDMGGPLDLVFEYGYGTGEHHTQKAMERFLDCCVEGKYDYREVETQLGPELAWCMIEILCRADVIEYGCSPRNGWLTGFGVFLKEQIESVEASPMVGFHA